MEATDILMSEHRVIERVLGVLETGAERLSEGQAVRPEFFIGVTDFVRGFADGCHHRKEEGALFPAVVAAGMPMDSGPVAVMLAEHEQGRSYIRALRGAAERLAGGDLAARSQVVEAAQGYVALLRAHIAKEDQILFPLAGQLIAPDRQREVTAAFERVEHEETGEGIHEKYLALADTLEREIAEPAR